MRNIFMVMLGAFAVGMLLNGLVSCVGNAHASEAPQWMKHGKGYLCINGTSTSCRVYRRNGKLFGSYTTAGNMHGPDTKQDMPLHMSRARKHFELVCECDTLPKF